MLWRQQHALIHSCWAGPDSGKGLCSFWLKASLHCPGAVMTLTVSQQECSPDRPDTGCCPCRSGGSCWPQSCRGWWMPASGRALRWASPHFMQGAAACMQGVVVCMQQQSPVHLEDLPLQACAASTARMDGLFAGLLLNACKAAAGRMCMGAAVRRAVKPLRDSAMLMVLQVQCLKGLEGRFPIGG